MQLTSSDVAHWRDELCRLFLGLDFEPDGKGAFKGAIEPILVSQGLRLGRFSHTAGSVTRSKGLIQDGNDDLVLLLPTKATMLMDTIGCNSAVKIGQAAIIRNSDVSRTTNTVENSIYALMVDPNFANDTGRNVHRSSGRILRSSKNLKMLTSYIAWLHRHSNSITAETSPVLCRQLLALTIICGSAHTDSAENYDTNDARLILIKDSLAKKFQDSTLNESSIAAEQGISVRYLQKLFEKEGTVFSVCLSEHRLQAAYKLLWSPAGSRSIQEIALDVGYNDLSNFHRMFKRKFGCTPADLHRRWREDTSQS